jgi:hypothetical protein
MNPRAPHLVPPHERLMMRPSSGRGQCRIKSVLRPGISDAKFVLSPAVPRCARSRLMRSPAASTPFASPVTRWCAGCSTAGARAAATSTAKAKPAKRQAFIDPQGRLSGRPFFAVRAVSRRTYCERRTKRVHCPCRTFASQRANERLNGTPGEGASVRASIATRSGLVK